MMPGLSLRAATAFLRMHGKTLGEADKLRRRTEGRASSAPAQIPGCLRATFTPEAKRICRQITETLG
jgi:hypothetical protein